MVKVDLTRLIVQSHNQNLLLNLALMYMSRHEQYRVYVTRHLSTYAFTLVFLCSGYSGDVWYPQPAPKDHPWRYMPNQAMTPHISGTTIDAQV